MIRSMWVWTCVLLAFSSHAEVGGTFKGSVVFDGVTPEPVSTAITADKKAGCTCETVLVESLVVDKKTSGIKWVIVRIQDVKSKEEPPKPAKPYQIDQKGCTFTPHVIVVPPDVELEVLNPDAILHNFHTTGYDFANPNQNIAILPTDKNKVYKSIWLKDPEIIEVKCDIHSWMKGFIVVHDPRYCAVTGEDGTFEIKNIPPGNYTVDVFHEKLGGKTVNVDIKNGATVDAGMIKFAPKK